MVGESGSGKTTIGRSILRLTEPDSGQVSWKGTNISSLPAKKLRETRKKLQIVFQDPYSSLNPRLTVGAILEEPFKIHHLLKKNLRQERVMELLLAVGLEADHRSRYPHEFSGGQRQRIGIARALAMNPELLILDEPVSALDLSVQAQILNLLIEIKQRKNLTYLFIAHDLAVVRYISDETVVLYLGRIFEYTQTELLFSDPRHPYTQALLASIPRRSPWENHAQTLSGEIPSPIEPPSGCVFHPRCAKAQAICKQEIPPRKARPDYGWYLCHF